MNYEITLKIIANTLEKKNNTRDKIIAQLNNDITNGTIKMYTLDIKGTIDKNKDYESYSSTP